MSDEARLAAIEAAIEKLQNGERVASVAYGDYAVKYERVELRDLLVLRDRVRSQLVAQTKNAKRRVVVATQKGV